MSQSVGMLFRQNRNVSDHGFILHPELSVLRSGSWAGPSAGSPGAT
jgi:hypothetical protein